MPTTVDRSLKRHCSLKIGGLARDVVIPASVQKLTEVYRQLLADGVEFRIIGKGSNVLFLDGGFNGVIIKNTRACPDLKLVDGRHGILRTRRRIYVGSSVPNQRLIRFCAKSNLDAPTYLQSVPGNVGGAIFMNAGTGLQEGSYFSDFIHRVHVYDGCSAYWLSRDNCGFGYRQSRFMESRMLILGCEIESGTRDGALTLRDAAARVQFAKQTQDDSYPNAGSVFNRGYKDIKSIRGMREGGAKFSEKTCNWIINDNRASSADVLRLIERAVAEHRAVGLDDPELEWIVIK